MSPRLKPAPADPGTAETFGVSTDEVLARAGRWLLAKVWLGCVLSGAYAAGRHFGWPQALLTTAGVLGALALSLASWWLPLWTARSSTGIAIIDTGLRIVVWGSLAACVVALLIGMPAVGAVAGALLISTAARTFHPNFKPLLRRYGLSTGLARRTSRGRRPGWTGDRRVGGSPVRGRTGAPPTRDVHAERARQPGDAGRTGWRAARPGDPGPMGRRTGGPSDAVHLGRRTATPSEAGRPTWRATRPSDTSQTARRPAGPSDTSRRTAAPGNTSHVARRPTGSDDTSHVRKQPAGPDHTSQVARPPSDTSHTSTRTPAPSNTSHAARPPSDTSHASRRTATPSNTTHMARPPGGPSDTSTRTPAPSDTGRAAGQAGGSVDAGRTAPSAVRRDSRSGPRCEPRPARVDQAAAPDPVR